MRTNKVTPMLFEIGDMYYEAQLHSHTEGLLINYFLNCREVPSGAEKENIIGAYLAKHITYKELTSLAEGVFIHPVIRQKIKEVQNG